MKPVRLLLHATIFCCALVSSAAKVPWSDPAQVELEISHATGTPFGVRSYPYLDSVYTARFGETPDFVIWADDKTIPAWAKGSVMFSPADPPPKHCTEVLPYIYLSAKSVESAASIRIPVIDAAYDTTFQVLSGARQLFITWRINLRKIGIPVDTSSWQLQLEMWDAPPPGGKRILHSDELNRPYVAHMVKTTPLDTLQWGLSTDLFRKNVDATKHMLSYFPDSAFLLSIVYHNALKDGDCDSLHYYTYRLLESRYYRRDPIYLDRGFLSEDGVDPDPGAFPLMPENYQAILTDYLNVCSDTTGFSSFKPDSSHYLPPLDIQKWIEHRMKEANKE